MTTTISPPTNLRALLGLGLKFIPTPFATTRWTAITNVPNMSLQRLERSLHLRSFFIDSPPLNPNAANPSFNPRMHTPSDWLPPTPFPPELARRLDRFRLSLQPLFHGRRPKFNLLLHQRNTLEQIKQHKDLLVVACDKNLGPAVLERSWYIQMALSEHLTDTTTYQPLTQDEANTFGENLRRKLTAWIHKYRKKLTPQERKFLLRHIEDCKDPFPYFYLLMKVHKTKLASRPIVSCSGSLLYSLGVWIDNHLQKIASTLPTYFKSSFELKQELLQLVLPPTARFFIADAVGMYTNIQTDPALQEIRWYLFVNSSKFAHLPINAILDALRLVMKNNVFQFGDTFWHQLTGCAMGTPPAPPYATLFYAIFEFKLLDEFADNLFFLRRYIDDMLGIWVVTDPNTDADTWARFTARLDDFHQLRWEASERLRQVDFLDLTLSIEDNHVVTTLFSKPLNLYLYIPPKSAHPPGVLTGLIFGSIHRIYTLCSSPADIRSRLQDFYRRLLARGYERPDILPLFQRGLANAKAHLANATVPTDQPPPSDPAFFFHMRYHPQDPTNSAIQYAWRNTVSQPPGEVPLSDLRFNPPNSFQSFPFETNRLIVCYHRPPNLGNLLSYRKITSTTGPPVSSFLD